MTAGPQVVESASDDELQPAPSLHGYAARSVPDALMLGVPGHRLEDDRLRDERAVAILDARDELADDPGRNAGLALHPPEIPSVDLALLTHRHGGNVAEVVDDPEFAASCRAHLGLAAGQYVSVEDGQVRRAWIDPLEDAATRERFHAELDRARGLALSGGPRRAVEGDESLDRWKQQVDDQVARFERGESPEALTRHVENMLGADVPSAVRFMRAPEANDAVMRQAAARDLAERDSSPEARDPAITASIRQGEEDLQQRYARWREAEETSGPTAGHEPGDEEDPAARAAGRDVSALARTETVAAQYSAAQTPTWQDDQNASTALSMAQTADIGTRSASPGQATLAAAHRSQATHQATNARLREVTEQVEDYADQQATAQPRCADRYDYPKRDGLQIGGPVMGRE